MRGFAWNGPGRRRSVLGRQSKKYRVWACEGGHTDFGPRNDLEIALLQYLIKQYGHVSYERVVSGMGIENIYKFLRDTARGQELPQVAAEMKRSDPGLVISKYADSGECPMCVQTTEIFVSAFGAEAGNMALKTMSTGGVYLGGGIPAKMLNEERRAMFIQSFNEKGRLSRVMQTMPVRIILNDQAALLVPPATPWIAQTRERLPDWARIQRPAIRRRWSTRPSFGLPTESSARVKHRARRQARSL